MRPLIVCVFLILCLAMQYKQVEAAPRDPTNASTAPREVTEDKKKTGVWVQAEAISRLSQNKNSGLAYIALNLASAKDLKTLNRIFDTAKNDHADPIMGRDATIAALKKGTTIFISSEASPQTEQSHV